MLFHNSSKYELKLQKCISNVQIACDDTLNEFLATFYHFSQTYVTTESTTKQELKSVFSSIIVFFQSCQRINVFVQKIGVNCCLLWSMLTERNDLGSSTISLNERLDYGLFFAADYRPGFSASFKDAKIINFFLLTAAVLQG